MFRALKHRSFALLWGGQTISRLGDFLYQIALAWWVLEKTGSAAIMATVLGSAWLWITVMVVALLNVTLAGPYTVALPFLVKDHLQTDVRLLGLLYAIFPIGYLLGSL